jgi:hypothetical protein
MDAVKIADDDGCAGQARWDIFKMPQNLHVSSVTV